MECVILSTVVNMLGNEVLKQATLFTNTKEDMEWLQRHLKTMQCALRDAHRKKTDHRVGNWIEMVRQLAYDAEDFVDTFHSRVGSSKSNSFARNLSSLMGRYRFGKDVKDLRRRVDELNQQRETYGIRLENLNNPSRMQERRWALVDIEEKKLVSLDHKVQDVKKLLGLAENRRRRSVVSLVGMGGIGKTTLAKRLYDELSKQFDCTAWVVVSQNHTYVDVLRNIIRKVGASAPSEEELDVQELEKILCDFLSGKKYLIVLDDVWEAQALDVLRKNSLPDIGNGSAVIVTTRSMEVAEANEEMVSYKVSCLDEESSWSLFNKHVFPENEGIWSSAHDQLEEKGRRMLKKCGGLPLAIKVLGAYLRRKKNNPTVWETLESETGINWNMVGEGDCMDILGLSFDDLEEDLQCCFMYFAAYPEDDNVEVEELLRLWMAEGFIRCEENEMLEAAAQRYLDELVDLCLVELFDRRRDGKDFYCCRVHDLVHELATRKAKEVGFLGLSWKLRKTGSNDTVVVRRLVVHDDESSIALSHKKLRTLLHREGLFNSVSKLNKMKLLRVLRLQIEWNNSTLDWLETLGHHLLNLRYLQLLIPYLENVDKILRLPSSFGNISMLQTLEIHNQAMILIPPSLLRVKTLRHLRGYKLQLPSDPEENAWPNLRYIGVVTTGSWVSKLLPNLLQLRFLVIDATEDEQMTECISNSISNLQHLQTLHIQRYIAGIGEIHCKNAFPQRLVTVKLYDGSLDQCTLNLLGNLPYLKFLDLCIMSFLAGEMVFMSNSFPCLEHLVIAYLSASKWVLEEQCFKCLRNLLIWNCTNLENLPEGLDNVTNLKSLHILDMPIRFTQRLRRDGEDWHKVKHMEKILINDSSLDF